MRFPRRIMRWAALSLAVAVAAALAGVVCWAWARLDAKLEVTPGPGVRLSARLSFDPPPPVQPLSLPSLPYIRDDVQYLEVPAPGLPARVEEPVR